ncbi:butyrate kinase [Geobacter sp. AOG1]|uniref:butyrate kinase n=1 Tax=Geobacter sp. AOG1 TaxID=1566346 RepID=UPI001CC368BA|nr:butyrate kinase [Geobacter sp. AOG1]GFE56312.1 putative butyrate kinase [Geobacter sp. AOG1]
METLKKILVINLGSTSTKVGIYLSDKALITESVTHSSEELKEFTTIFDQYELRRNAILSVLGKHEVSLDELDAIASRGGNTKPIPGGIYRICPEMIDDTRSGKFGMHPNVIGCMVAYDLGREKDIPAVSIDHPTTDELCVYARYSGLPQIKRQSSFHALNQKATARKISALLGKSYDETRLIVVHIGGGISVGAHRNGKVIDVNNALDGDGPFSPERAGTLPTGDLIKMCFSGEYTKEQMLRLIQGQGGLVAYLGTSSGIEIEKRIAAGDKEAAEVFEAMSYQIAKEIGACAAVLEGKVDGIALTGSLAYSKTLTESLIPKISFIAKVYLDPGENEMDALAAGVMRYFDGKEPIATY